MIDKVQSFITNFPWSPGWIAVILILILQGATLAYTFGKLSDHVSENSIAIKSIVHTEQSYALLSKKLAVIGQRLSDDEELLHNMDRKLDTIANNPK